MPVLTGEAGSAVPLAIDGFRLGKAFIGGQWTGSSAQRRVIEVLDPATERIISEVPDVGGEGAKLAVDAAAAALLGWRTIPAQMRSEKLRAVFDQLNRHREELAGIITREQGKPFSEAKAEVDYAASYFLWFAEEARRSYGTIIPPFRPDDQLLVILEPIGVVAAITPWNAPLAMVARKVAPALAAGCTVVVKPAEQTPLSALALARLIERAGFPEGAFNVVTGEPVSIGKALTEDPVVRKLSFTGSTQVGKLLLAQCAPTVKKVSVELGGHAPFIVFEDADIDTAVEAALTAKFRASGQSCVSANRFIVHEEVYEAFTTGLVDAVARLRTGAGTELDTQVGPMIDRNAVRRLEVQVADAQQAGARIAIGSRQGSGCFFQPTVLVDVDADARIMREETFGPVAPVTKFGTEGDALDMARHPEFGLAAYVMTRDADRMWRVARALETGMIGFNTGLISDASIPFGGVKASGLGREGSWLGMREYLTEKYVCIAPSTRSAAHA